MFHTKNVSYFALYSLRCRENSRGRPPHAKILCLVLVVGICIRDHPLLKFWQFYVVISLSCLFLRCLAASLEVGINAEMTGDL